VVLGCVVDSDSAEDYLVESVAHHLELDQPVYVVRLELQDVTTLPHASAPMLPSWESARNGFALRPAALPS
jgi:hypothetical protein